MWIDTRACRPADDADQERVLCDKRRFEKPDRVVCKYHYNGTRAWVAGAILRVSETDPDDRTGRRKLPYVVKADRPVNKLLSVPLDEKKENSYRTLMGILKELATQAQQQ